MAIKTKNEDIPLSPSLFFFIYDALHVQEFEEDLAAAEVKEEGGAEGGADAAGLGVGTKQYVIRKLYTSGGDIPQM